MKTSKRGLENTSEGRWFAETIWFKIGILKVKFADLLEFMA